MPSRSKAKGNRFERECVNKAREAGFEAKRAYASNGLSLGLEEDVDMLIENIPIQCKTRARIASWIKPPDSCKVTLVKEDRGEIYAILRFTEWMELINETKER